MQGLATKGLEPPRILGVFHGGGVVLEPYEVAEALGLQVTSKHRYRQLLCRLRLMVRAGWLACETDADGREHYMAALAHQVAMPVGVVEAFEEIARTLRTARRRRWRRRSQG